jgi:hypothetical protein
MTVIHFTRVKQTHSEKVLQNENAVESDGSCADVFSCFAYDTSKPRWCSMALIYLLEDKLSDFIENLFCNRLAVNDCG